MVGTSVARLSIILAGTSPEPLELALHDALFPSCAIKGKAKLIEAFVDANGSTNNLEEYHTKYLEWSSNVLDQCAGIIHSPMSNLLNSLSARQRQVLHLRFGLEGNPKTLLEVSEMFGVTKERIRQIEAEALQALRLHDSLRQALKQARQTILPLLDKATKSAPVCEIPTLLTKHDINKGRRKVGLNASLESPPQHEAEWLTGFWEGDGSLQLVNQTLQVIFSQKDPRVLDHIKLLLGLQDKKLYQRSIPTQFYNLRVAGSQAEVLLELLCNHLVSEDRVQQILRAVEPLSLNLVPTLHEPTLPWIAGFFDAEGSIGYNGNKRNKYIYLGASISQKNVEVLEKIQDVIGGQLGRPRKQSLNDTEISRLSLRKSEILDFLPSWLKYSHNPQKQERLYKHLQEANRREESRGEDA